MIYWVWMGMFGRDDVESEAMWFSWKDGQRRRKPSVAMGEKIIE